MQITIPSTITTIPEAHNYLAQYYSKYEVVRKYLEFVYFSKRSIPPPPITRNSDGQFTLTISEDLFIDVQNMKRQRDISDDEDN
jgi:hypothetical protein